MPVRVIVERACAYSSSQRHQSAAELLEDVHGALEMLDDAEEEGFLDVTDPSGALPTMGPLPDAPRAPDVPSELFDSLAEEGPPGDEPAEALVEDLSGGERPATPAGGSRRRALWAVIALLGFVGLAGAGSSWVMRTSPLEGPGTPVEPEQGPAPEPVTEPEPGPAYSPEPEPPATSEVRVHGPAVEDQNEVSNDAHADPVERTEPAPPSTTPEADSVQPAPPVEPAATPDALGGELGSAVSEPEPEPEPVRDDVVLLPEGNGAAVGEVDPSGDARLEVEPTESAPALLRLTVGSTPFGRGRIQVDGRGEFVDSKGGVALTAETQHAFAYRSVGKDDETLWSAACTVSDLTPAQDGGSIMFSQTTQGCEVFGPGE